VEGAVRGRGVGAARGEPGGCEMFDFFVFLFFFAGEGEDEEPSPDEGGGAGCSEDVANL